MEKFEEEPCVLLTSDAALEILYPGKSQEERNSLLEHLKAPTVLEKGRCEKMRETIWDPIAMRMKDKIARSGLLRRQAGIATTAADGLLDTIKELDGLDSVSQKLTVRNHILRIACKVYENSKVCKATWGPIISQDAYQAFKESLPYALQDSFFAILMEAVEGSYKLRSPEDVIVSMVREKASSPDASFCPRGVFSLMDTRVKYPSVSSLEEVGKLSQDSVDARVGLLRQLSELAGKTVSLDAEAQYNKIIQDFARISEVEYPGKKADTLNAVLDIDRKISDFIVAQGASKLHEIFDTESRDLQQKSLNFRSECAQQSLALLEALTKDIDDGGADPKTLLEALDLGERALTEDMRPLWSFTFDNEDSETQFDAAEQLKREASFLSGVLVVGMANTFADVEALTEARVAYAGTMISQLLLSSPLMREAVVEVMGEELKPNPASHLGTLSREMPTVLHKESAKVMRDMAGQLGPGSGDTRISGGKWTQSKKALEFILKRPTHWLIGLPLVFGALALIIGAGILISSTVPGLIIAGTLTLSSGFLLMILGAFGVTFQLQYFTLLFGLLFGTKCAVAKVFASDHLTQLWKVTQGDRRATLAYYKSKRLDDSSGVKLTRNRWSKDSLGGDLALLRAQAAQEYVAEMGNTGLEALIKSAEERLVKLGKLSDAYNSMGSEVAKRRRSPGMIRSLSGTVISDSEHRIGKTVTKFVKRKSGYRVVCDPKIIDGKVPPKLEVGGEVVVQRQRHIVFPEIVSLAGCLMREEALDKMGGMVDKRKEDLAFTMDRVQSVLFDAGNSSIQEAVSGLTAY